MDASLSEIALLLRETTERLAREVGAPGENCPQWPRLTWQIAKASVAMQGMGAILCSTLRWAGPEDWQAYLRDQAEQGELRERRVISLIKAIDSDARNNGLAVMALKGAALRCLDVYASGVRPMADVDLLIEPRSTEAAIQLLARCDYRLLYSGIRHRVFGPLTQRSDYYGDHLGEHASAPLKVELHTEVAECLPVTKVDITREIMCEAGIGLMNYPTRSALMLHLLLHAAGNMRANALRQIQLHDIALIARGLKDDDWACLLQFRPSGAPIWWAFPPLALTVRYYGNCVPPCVLDELKMFCSWYLRRQTLKADLTMLSWSNIRIPAFPGIGWSSTILEALRFARGRIWPSAVALNEMRSSASEMSLQAVTPWYGVSHMRRVMLWLVSSPPRVQTLACVRRALAA